MKQIKIGTCVPGPVAEEWLKGFVGKGFETFSLNFHMSLEGTDLDKLALSTEQILAGTDSKITTLGYYCNPIQYPEHRKTLEKVICTAEKFGATHVSTFAGAWEGKPVESAYEEFGKVFRELAELAEEKGVKLEFTDDALMAIAHMAVERKTGARGLRSIMESLMMDTMYEIPSDSTIGICTITKDVVEGKSAPELVYRDNTVPRKSFTGRSKKDRTGEIA